MKYNVWLIIERFDNKENYEDITTEKLAILYTEKEAIKFVNEIIEKYER